MKYLLCVTLYLATAHTVGSVRSHKLGKESDAEVLEASLED